MKRISLFFILFGVSPMLFSTALLTFYFHAGSILGRPPRYNQPDPKELAIYSDYDVFIDFGFMIWLYAFLPWLIFTAFVLIRKRDKVHWAALWFSAMMQLAAVLLLFSRIMEWYVD